MIRTHWFGENVATIDTTLDDLPARLPVFDRYPLGRNRFRDLIVRRAPPLPIGTVSKKYVLVQHADAIAAVTAEIKKAGIDATRVPAHLLISEYGTRIAVRATLPDSYTFTPDDGHPMALTFECFNSVDGSVPLFAAVGWFRFVCSNGLVVGNTAAKVRQRHLPPLKIDQFSAVLAEGMESALREQKSFEAWRSTEVADSDLARWVDGPVADAWGPLAAARVYGISTTGCDGRPERSRRGVPPHAWPLTIEAPVPGTDAPCTDAYEIAQVLAWVAAQRGNVAKRLEWRGQIRGLMSHLVQ